MADRVSGDGRAGATAPTTTTARSNEVQTLHDLLTALADFERLWCHHKPEADAIAVLREGAEIRLDRESGRAALTRLGGAHE